MKYLLICFIFVGAIYWSYQFGREAERAEIHRQAEGLARNLCMLRDAPPEKVEPRYTLFEQLQFFYVACNVGIDPPLILFPAFFEADPSENHTASPDKLLFALKPTAGGKEVIIVTVQGDRRTVTYPMEDIMESQLPFMKDYLDSEKSR